MEQDLGKQPEKGGIPFIHAWALWLGMAHGLYMFWFDTWCGDCPLKISFLTPFDIGSSRNAWVAGLWEGESDQGVAFTETSRIGR